MQRGVERERGVAFGEHEAVAVGIVGPAPRERAGEERGEDVGDREARADMADVRAPRLLDHDTPDPIGEVVTRQRSFSIPRRSRTGSFVGKVVVSGPYASTAGWRSTGPRRPSSRRIR